MVKQSENGASEMSRQSDICISSYIASLRGVHFQILIEEPEEI